MLIKNFRLPSDGVFVIAEVGSNHQGSLGKAKEHIDAAAHVGAQAVKFQSLNIDRLYKDPSPQLCELHAVIDFEESWHAELKEYSDRKGVIFCSSPTYLEALKILCDLDIDFIKIASAQVSTFPQLINAVANSGKPAFLSTGISSYDDISKAVEIFEQNGNKNYALLHCNSQYPTPYENVHLGLIATYRKMFDCPVGFSDHTAGTAVVLAAVALGANIIEKHFVIDDSINSPDAPFSINPYDFQRMVDDIKKVKASCTPSTRVLIHNHEAKFKDLIRYKLVLKHEKLKGEPFLSSDFDYLRHQNGIDVTHERLIQDRFVAKQQISPHTLLDWTHLIAS